MEKEAEGEETFVTVANDYLKIKKVSFDGQDTSRIFVNAKLALPKLDNKEVMANCRAGGKIKRYRGKGL
ncbi:MAG: hypothetical protein U5P10_08310 [Spirochaetia bacterium]|nr:hypothetical protein [Spirochaetia bacterium]